MIFKESPGIFRYRPAAVLRITGEDALSFLQGQFTQDLHCRTGNLAAYGLWLNQKGKVIADSFVLAKSASECWVVSTGSSGETVGKRLEAYIVADDVVVENLTEEWEGVVVMGTHGSQWMMKQLGGRPLPPPGQCLWSEDVFAFGGRRGRAESWEFLFRLGTADAQLAGAPLIDAMEMARSRIEAGIPAIPEELGLGDLPNEGKLDAEAISYTKGCYLGQEVMARVKSLGRVRRQLFRVRSEHSAPPGLPIPLFVADKIVGELRSIAPDQSGFVGMAMVTLAALGEARTVNLGGQSGHVAHLEELVP